MCDGSMKWQETLEKRLSEHKNAVKKHDSNNGIAAHAWTTNTKWTGRLRRQEKRKGTTGREEYWKPCTSTNSSTPQTRNVV